MVAVGLASKFPFTSIFYITLTCTIGSALPPLYAIITSVFDLMPGLNASCSGRGSSTLWQYRRCWLDRVFNSWGKESECNRSSTQGHSQDITTSKSGDFQVALQVSGWKRRPRKKKKNTVLIIIQKRKGCCCTRDTGRIVAELSSLSYFSVPTSYGVA